MFEHTTDFQNGNIDWREFAGHFFSDAHPMFSQFNVNITDVSKQGVKMEASLGPDFKADKNSPVSYTHLTLPTNREV